MKTFPSYIPQENRPAILRRVGEIVRQGCTLYYATLAGGRYTECTDFAELAALVNSEEDKNQKRIARTARFLQGQEGAVSAVVTLFDGREVTVFRDGTTREGN